MIESSQNKQVTDAPAKKSFHFAATAEYLAEYIEAETIAEATEIYHKIKKLIDPSKPASSTTAQLADGTVSADQKKGGVAVGAYAPDEPKEAKE